MAQGRRSYVFAFALAAQVMPCAAQACGPMREVTQAGLGDLKSPDGRWIVFASPDSATHESAFLSLKHPQGDEKPLFVGEYGRDTRLFWTGDSRFLVSVSENVEEDEIVVYAVKADGFAAIHRYSDIIVSNVEIAIGAARQINFLNFDLASCRGDVVTLKIQLRDSELSYMTSHDSQGGPDHAWRGRYRIDLKRGSVTGGLTRLPD